MATPGMPEGYSSTGVAGASAWTPQDDKVDTEVARITAQDGPLMQQAKTAGLAQAQRRGLLNSSMAVGAAQESVLRTALPMASQNAAQTAQKNLSSQQYGENRGLADQKFGHDTKLSEQNYNQTYKLNEQTFGQQKALSEQSHQQAAALTELQGHWQQAISDQDYRQKSQLVQLDNGSKERIATMQVDSNNREKMLSYLAAMENSYAGLFNGIQNNANIPADVRDKYMQHIGAIRDSTLSMAQQMYGISVTWNSASSGTAKPFDGAAYLRANPDVAANAYFAQHPEEHWRQYGQAEGRKW
jgi:hypothetical protein